MGPGMLEMAIFYAQERSFFHRLVRDLGQEREHMRWVIALWLWLEADGHDKFMRRASALPGPVVLRFVDEALACLARLAGRELAGAGTLLPCTNALLNRPIDDVTYFEEHRDKIMPGVKLLYKTVCRVVLDDTCASDDAIFLPRSSTASVPRAIGSPAFAGPTPVPETPTTPTTPRFADLNAIMTPRFSQLNAMAPPWSPVRVAQQHHQQHQMIIDPLPEEFRSLFITFSRGYPIDKDDIKEFFNSLHGPCVEDVMVERAPAGQLPVYGRVVLQSPDMIPVLLGGEPTAKYIIKGRHLWARVYVPSSRHSTFIEA
ncbi:hypothetical protein D1007_00071 [Hordeum vulgare]|uniref:Uncharacterized protein n=1 Tax=Hordeum vulgare subsp. vulgare TaxID=112509 RepID=A0A8I6WJR2_HORVV|nr:uncharacterized protein LOC123439503 [Hordeum vulgare subsp. vulgare]KAE8821878.1 hypothetical protein D1007_00071 [Hordeum vulgare]KAI5018051.1 hypothetical protein ZWY2020_042939 [Hordeum vulgare]